MNKQYLAKLFLLSGTVGITVFFAQGTIPFKPDKHTVENTPPVKLPDTITLADAILLHQNKSNVFIDVREKQFYDYAHIVGSVNLPAEDAPGDKIGQETINKLKNAPNIVIYGISNSDPAPFSSARLLAGKGVNNIKVYKDGWSQWKACKLPVEAAPSATSNSNQNQR